MMLDDDEFEGFDMERPNGKNKNAEKPELKINKVSMVWCRMVW